MKTRSRNQFTNLHTAGLGLAVASVLAACGGSDGTPAAAPPPAAATTITITGVAAKGAPFSGATVVASNPSGTVGTPQTVAADGTYSITLPIETATPIVLVASKTLSSGETESYTSVVADKANTTANITPVTNVIAALLSPNGNPAQLASQVASGTAISQATLAAKTKSVQDVLQSASTALGVANVNPLTDTFSANGTGYDKLLDSLNTSITPSGASSNIEIGLKVQAANDTAQPPVSQFTSSQASLPALPAITASSFLATGTTAKLVQLLADSTVCYGLPLATRVSTATASSTSAVGTAADVAAAQCKALFIANDPTNYKFGGSGIGRNAAGQGSFAGIFNSTANGAVFDTPVYEYTLQNGDIAFSFQSKTPTGTPVAQFNFARLDPADQKLKFVGDQYDYQGSVQPFMQRREFLTLGLDPWNYFSTGYNFNVNNTGQFSKVVVVAPNGKEFTLVPNGAVSFLNFVGKGSSSFLRFRSEFIDTTKAFSVPAKLTSEATNLAFETPEFTEAEIAALPAQSAWTFKYFLTANTGTSPNAVQVYRTRGRALTIAELRARTFPALTADSIATIRTNSSQTTGNVLLDSTAGAAFSWTVPTGALPPTGSTLFGRYLNGATATSTSSFTDTQSYAASARTITIPCSMQSATDGHCAGATNGGFKAGSVANGLNLIATDSLSRQFANQYNAYSLTIAP
jgi:hypothetical protein